MMPAIERTTAQHGRPTYYETLLALAFCLLRRRARGRRRDRSRARAAGSTERTSSHPVVAAITSVGYDHTDVLGTTLEAIAREKAGIAKRGVPLVVAPVPPPRAT